MSGMDTNARLNLAKASVLVIDGSQHSLEVTSQIVRGFGVASVHRCDNLEDAEKLAKKAVDLVVIDPSIGDGGGYDFLMRMRRTPGPNSYVPVILVNGHVRPSDVARARNAGANFVVTKPIASTVLLQRIMWVAKDKRPFVEIETGYVGPDRRFKFEGPPAGSDGRRATDLSSEVGDAKEENLSQDELDAMFKPQKVSL